jgi:2-amino-4-hydroxy-6-hydroxymethyldihydropteridine diphosphokinase
MEGSGSAGHTVRAFVGLGSNLGDRLANLQRAVGLLAARNGVTVVASSRVYETAPVGPAQPDYLNAVVEAATILGAREVLETCLSVEEELGRVRAERWGPRLIDLDLLLFGDQTIDEPGLTVPHPRMFERLFVLVPLVELITPPALPEGRSIGALRLDASGTGAVRLFAHALSAPSVQS